MPVTTRSKACVCSRSLAGIVGSNPARGMVDCVCVLSDRGLCFGPITRPEQSYRAWCVWVWSWILDTEEALDHWGLLCHGKKKPFQFHSSTLCHRLQRSHTMLRPADWKTVMTNSRYCDKIQGDQKVSMHLMITIQKVTSNVQSVPPPQSPDIYWH
jgi:hypothetical protein